MPESKAELSISVDSLLKLPSEAVYTHHSGQATASVARKGDVIYVAATCDSLQREVEYFEELYYRARDALEQYENSVQTEVKQPSNFMIKLIVLFAMGFVAGIGLTVFIIITKKNGK